MFTFVLKGTAIKYRILVIVFTLLKMYIYRAFQMASRIIYKINTSVSTVITP